MLNSKGNCCCKRFERLVNEKSICPSCEYDETEWFIPGWFHLYYCPFCGTFIKGEGFGIPEKPYSEGGSR